MIITQTPLRVGLVGGGTDLPAYYREHGGRVLNAAIDKYVYVVVKQRFDDDIYLNYSQKEIVSRVEDLQHDLVREAMHMAGVRHGVEITTLADIPSAGSGLGSSSSITVGLLQALFAYQGVHSRPRSWPSGPARSRSTGAGSRSGSRTSTPRRTAASATCDSVPATGSPSSRSASSRRCTAIVQAELMLFYTGLTRSADAILRNRTPTSGTKLAQLDLLRDLAGGAVDALREGDTDHIGVALNKSWEAKRSLASGVSNTLLDEAVDAAVDAGATGAKIAGAGGGGFVLVVCPVQHQAAVAIALAEMKELPIKIDPYGSRVVLNVHRDIWG